MSSFNSLLGYSVAVGDFNEDGEDGKTFQLLVILMRMVKMVRHFKNFLMELQYYCILLISLSFFFFLSLSEQIFEKHNKMITDGKCLSGSAI